MSDELAAANSRLVATVDRLKATQAQLLQAEKLSAIGSSSPAGAPLNNPLTSVIGYGDSSCRRSCAVTPERRGAPAEARSSRATCAGSPRNRTRRPHRPQPAAFARRQSAARAEQDIADVMSRVLSLRAYELRLNAIELRPDFNPVCRRCWATAASCSRS